MKHVIQTTDVLSYEQFGFTNCVRFGDVLYLSGISALDPQGQVLGSDIETQTIHTYRNIERVLRAGGSGLDQILQMTSFVLDLERNGARYVAARQKILTSHTYTSAVIGVSALMMRAAAGGSMLCRGHCPGRAQRLRVAKSDRRRQRPMKKAQVKKVKKVRKVKAKKVKTAKNVRGGLARWASRC